MRRTLFKSKIHNATLTGADLEYEGSILVDRDLMDAADLRPYEMVHVLNAANGERLITYVIEGERGTGELCLNGPAARLGHPGDRIVIFSYAEFEEAEIERHSPRVVLVDEDNRPLRPALRSRS
jgi:aspartate 1-decarboxylase